MATVIEKHVLSVISHLINMGKKLGWSVLSIILFPKMLQQRSSLLLKVGLGVILSMFLTYFWYSSQMSDTGFKSGRYIDSRQAANAKLAQKNVTGGLRMVVFGGGDIATPPRPAIGSRGREHTWTEIMCQTLGCDTYLSFIPETDSRSIGGAVLSNPLLEAAYNHASASKGSSKRDDDTTPGQDYAWAAEQYPRPRQPDLATQVDTFLASARAQEASTESLWVFNIGYWDIWYLAALPRGLAKAVLDSDARDLFFQIERLYHATHDRKPIATPLPSPDLGLSLGASAFAFASERGRGSHGLLRPPPPFRIFLTRLFDISLAPGFASARPQPPLPHTASGQLRNAAFLTEYWNALLEAVLDEWLATPDPEHWTVADVVDIDVVAVLAGKKPPKKKNQGGEEEDDDDDEEDHHHHSYHGGEFSSLSSPSLPPRRVASYGLARYLRELIIDRQLRGADLADHTGLGARPPEDGFLDVSMPCVLRVPGTVADTDTDTNGNGTEKPGPVVVCREPDNYLFHTEFSVGRRAIREIGVRAARRFLDQIEPESAWREKARAHKMSDGR